MSGTPLLDRPTAPPAPPRNTGGGTWFFAAFIAVALLASVILIAFPGILGTDDVPVTPAQPGDTTGVIEPAEPPVPAEEPAEPPAIVHYGEELRANWIVTGVEPGDQLNVRTGPGVSYEIIAGLTPSSPELESTGRIATVDGQRWREIVVPGNGVGWVNARYLGEIPPPASLQPRYREEPRANWDVRGVAADDVLNVRSGPGVAFDIVATLRPNAAELESTGRIADVGQALWREIIVPGDGVGWVNAAFLTETQ